MSTILITGASAGIGAATARLFLEAGWSVGLAARRVSPLEELAEGHANAQVLPCDVTDEDQVARAFAAFTRRFGRLDVLFNNAGRSAPAAPIDEIAPETFRAVIDVNVTAMFLCARAAFAAMRAQRPKGGRIINNGSISAHMPRPGTAPYTASKHAVSGLTKTIALDGRAHDIACGQIDIGNAGTEMAAAFARGVPQADGSVRPEPVMDVKHVARAVLHMASLPPEANVLSMNVMATKMPFVGRG